MWFSYPQNPSPPTGDRNAPNTAQAWLWDPATGATKRVDPPLWRDPTTGAQAGQHLVRRPDLHRRRAAGGVRRQPGRSPAGPVTARASTRSTRSIPWNETWTEQPDMRHGRWYPTGVRMADGRIADHLRARRNRRRVHAQPRRRAIHPVGRSERPRHDRRCSAHPARRGPSPPIGGLLPPHVRHALGTRDRGGPFAEDTWFLNPAGRRRTVLGRTSRTWQADRVWGTAVLMPGGTGGSTQVMQLGGSSTTSSGASVNAQPRSSTRQARAGLARSPVDEDRRGHHNTVLLPDGSMVTVGGGVGAGARRPMGGDPEQRQVELWDPLTGDWTLGPSQAETAPTTPPRCCSPTAA